MSALRTIAVGVVMLALASCTRVEAQPEVTLRVRGLATLPALRDDFVDVDEVTVTLYLRRGGAVTTTDGGGTDAGRIDASAPDAARTDGGASDASADANVSDASPADAGSDSMVEIRRVMPWDRSDPFETIVEVPEESYIAARVEISVVLFCTDGTAQRTVLARGVSDVITASRPLVPRTGAMSAVELEVLAVGGACR